ncbi:hypothetical protein [Halodesulfovibrio aestuarii]|uniref:Uncharacterized protein n=1 Tax=Halodesulfovibrio aestuarii TaxID=126333 RepID=A0A8G2C8J6_9BACT|nr:hypothetical protein [Halodesulfovibrio aestuarii]SHI82703.1 hypothetical protein SAMN05660830_01123 [Halodesulfovibrio aestuarii]
MKKYVQVSDDMCIDKTDEEYPTKVICEACFDVIMSNPEQELIVADATGKPAPDAECEFKLAYNCESL